MVRAGKDMERHQGSVPDGRGSRREAADRLVALP